LTASVNLNKCFVSAALTHTRSLDSAGSYLTQSCRGAAAGADSIPAELPTAAWLRLGRPAVQHRGPDPAQLCEMKVMSRCYGLAQLKLLSSSSVRSSQLVCRNWKKHEAANSHFKSTHHQQVNRLTFITSLGAMFC